MAIRCSFPNIIPARKKTSPATARAPVIIGNRHAQLKIPANTLKKFSSINKVFEDKETGVVCYRDEYGELICEGYDEGPRYAWQPSKETMKESDELSDGLQRLRISGIVN